MQLCDALVWDYKLSDMYMLIEGNSVRILSGCVQEIEESNAKTFELTPETAFRPLRAAWGRERNFYSLENLDKSAQK